MSIAAVKELAGRVSEDASMRSKLEEAIAGGSDPVSALVSFAAEHGTDISAKDVQSALEDGTAGELSDSALDGVAGGGFRIPTAPQLVRVFLKLNVTDPNK